jgi:hypothetical protein
MSIYAHRDQEFPVVQWRTSHGVIFSNLTFPTPDSKAFLVVGTQNVIDFNHQIRLGTGN